MSVLSSLCGTHIPSVGGCVCRCAHMSIYMSRPHICVTCIPQFLALFSETRSPTELGCLIFSHTDCPASCRVLLSLQPLPWLQWLVTTASLCYLGLQNLNSDLHDCTRPVWITEPAPNPSRITFRRWKHRLAFWIPTTTLILTWKRAINIWSYTEGSTLMIPYRKTWVKYWLACCYPRHEAEDLSQAKIIYCSCRGPSSVLSNCEETHTIHKGSW